MVAGGSCFSRCTFLFALCGRERAAAGWGGGEMIVLCYLLGRILSMAVLRAPLFQALQVIWERRRVLGGGGGKVRKAALGEARSCFLWSFSSFRDLARAATGGRSSRSLLLITVAGFI